MRKPHCYTERTREGDFSFLRTDVMNLLRRSGYPSISEGLRGHACKIKGMQVMALQYLRSPLDHTFRQGWGLLLEPGTRTAGKEPVRRGPLAYEGPLMHAIAALMARPNETRWRIRNKTLIIPTQRSIKGHERIQ